MATPVKISRFASSATRTEKKPMKRQASKTQVAALRAKTGPARSFNMAAKLSKAVPSARAQERASSKASFKRVPGPENAVAGKPSKVRARPGTTTYKATPKPKPAAVEGKNPLAQIGEALDKLIPTRKWQHPVVPKPRREVNVPTIVRDSLKPRKGQ